MALVAKVTWDVAHKYDFTYGKNLNTYRKFTYLKLVASSKLVNFRNVDRARKLNYIPQKQERA